MHLWEVFGVLGTGSNFVFQPHKLLLSQGTSDTLLINPVVSEGLIHSSHPNYSCSLGPP